jgi:hypothetical protein
MVRPAPAALATLLALAFLAGCTSPSATSGDATTGYAPPLASGWRLDCSLGGFERAHNASWLQDCEARASHTQGQKQEIWLAVNPNDASNVVIGAKDLNPDLSNHCVWNGLFVTKDGGKTWTDTAPGGPYASRGANSPYYGYACNTDPMGAFTADGKLHWVVEIYNLGGTNGYGPAADPNSGRGVFNPGWKLVLAESDDGGLTWPDGQATTLEYGDGVAYLNDYSRVVVNPSTQSVITMINTYYPGAGANAAPVTSLLPVGLPVGVGGVVCSLLPYRGQAEPAQPVPVQPTLVTATKNPGGVNCDAIAANKEGKVVVEARGSPTPTGGGGTAAWFATSTDDGATFSDFSEGFTLRPQPGQFQESQYRTGTGFEMKYDTTTSPYAGRLYTLTSERLGDDESDIVLHFSDDDGAHWTGPIRVNADPQGSHQFEPDFAIAADGSLHAFWMDKSYDPAHRLVDVTHAVSTDGGKTWTQERVTSKSWDGDLGKHQEDFPFIGDYTGAAASGMTVWAGFPDTSNGSTSVVAAIKVVHS